MKWMFAFLAVMWASLACAQDALVVQTCGTLPLAYAPGSNRLLTVDTNGRLCNSASASGLQFTNNIVYSGASSAANSWIMLNGLGLSGTASQAGDGVISPLHFWIGSDTVNTTTSGNGNLVGLSVLHATSAGSTGGRSAIQGSENIVGLPTTLTTAGYVGVLGITRVSSTLGGATGVYGNYKGAAFGGTSNVFTNSNSTFLTGIFAHEFDTTLDSTSSAAEKHSLNIVLGASDATRAVYDDNAIQFGAQDNATPVGWKTGIMFGSYAHQWPFATDSTLIGTQIRQTGAASNSVALNGVDLTNVTFSGNPFISPLGSSTKMSFAAAGNSATGLYFPNVNQVSLCGSGNCGLVVNGAGLTTVQIGLSVTSMATATSAVYMTGLATSAVAQVSFLCRDANNQIIADTGATCIVSSGRVKEAVDPLLDGLASVLRLVPVSFNYKKTGNPDFDSGINHKARQVGFIAEQAEAVDKRLVTYDSGGQPSGFRYESYVAVLTRAIQQQQQQIAELQRAVRRRSR